MIMEPRDGPEILEMVVQAQGDAVIAPLQLGQKETEYFVDALGSAVWRLRAHPRTEKYSLVDGEQTLAGARLAVSQVEHHAAQRFSTFFDQHKAIVLAQAVQKRRETEHVAVRRRFCKAIPPVLVRALDQPESHAQLLMPCSVGCNGRQTKL
jgi:hypothetical protein